jgi:AcrR family transcriptional regulator
MATSTSSKAKASRDGAVEDRPGQLIEIASRLFASRGYEGTSLRDIAEEARITKAALYYHFPNKEALHQQIVLRNMQALIDRVEAAVAAADGATGRVRAFMLASADLYAESPHDWISGSNAFWSGMAPDSRAATVRLRDRFEKLLRRCIAEGVASGEFRQVDPAIAGRLLLSAMNQLTRWHSAEGRLSAHDVIEQYLDIVLRGLQRAASGKR